MSTLRWSRTGISTFVATLTVALASQLSVTAQEQVIRGQTLAAAEQVPALAPDPGPSWEEASGYQSVEASRVDMAMAIGTAADAASGYRSVEATRVLVAQRALEAGNLGSMQEDALRAVVEVAPSWDETSGFGAVETGRAANSAPLADSLQQALAIGTRAETAHLATIPLPIKLAPDDAD